MTGTATTAACARRRPASAGFRIKAADRRGAQSSVEKRVVGARAPAAFRRQDRRALNWLPSPLRSRYSTPAKSRMRPPAPYPTRASRLRPASRCACSAAIPTRGRKSTVAGDAALAREILYIAQNLKWDVEEDLSRVFGDVAAHRMVDGRRRIAALAARQHAAALRARWPHTGPKNSRWSHRKAGCRALRARGRQLARRCRAARETHRAIAANKTPGIRA